MRNKDRQLSSGLQRRLTLAQHPTLPTLYYLRVNGGEGMHRYLTRTMTRQKFKEVSGKLGKAVHILMEKDMTIHVATEGLTLL